MACGPKSKSKSRHNCLIIIIIVSRPSKATIGEVIVSSILSILAISEPALVFHRRNNSCRNTEESLDIPKIRCDNLNSLPHGYGSDERTKSASLPGLTSPTLWLNDHRVPTEIYKSQSTEQMCGMYHHI